MENNMQRGYLWVCRTIETCNNLLQLETAERVIENFRKNNRDEGINHQLYYKFKQKAMEMNYFKYKEIENSNSRLAIN